MNRSLLVHTREGLDWIGRGRVAGASNKGVAELALRVGYRSTYQHKYFGIIAALVESRWFNPHARWSKMASIACNLLADLDRASVLRCLYSIVLHVEYVQCAHGTCAMVVRQPHVRKTGGSCGYCSLLLTIRDSSTSSGPSTSHQCGRNVADRYKPL